MDWDNDNICGFDMDFDGDKDFYDDLLYDDRVSHDSHSSSKSRKNDSNKGISKGLITFIVLVIVLTLISGSFEGVIGAALIIMGIIWYIKNFIF